MNTVPLGRMKTAIAFIAAVVVAASAAAPRCATIKASESPTTTCVERETMMGHARPRMVGAVASTRDVAGAALCMGRSCRELG